MKISREVKTGFIVVVALGLLIYGLFFLKGVDLFKDRRQFYAVYSNIGSLAPSSAIRVNGFKIGVVSDVSLMNSSGSKILVTFHIQEPNIMITDSTEARIITDLLGSASIEFLNRPGYTTEYVSNDTLIGTVAKDLQSKVDEQLAPLKIKIEQMVGSIDSVVTIVQAILNEDARDNLSASFESIKKSFANFERTSMKLDTLIASQASKISSIFSKVDNIATNLANNSENLTNIISNFSAVSDSLAAANITQTIHQAKKAMEDVSEIVDKINNGEGSMGLLINDTKLYDNLTLSADNLQKLIDDYNRNPQKYLHFSVFGRKVKKQVVQPDKVFDDKEIEQIKKMLKDL